jgi:hypothetical protein
MKKFTDKLNESVENKIPTAEEFFTSVVGETPDEFNGYIKECMIQFAKLHVEATLKAASEDAHTKDVPYTDDVEVDKETILSAYPLENIK